MSKAAVPAVQNCYCWETDRERYANVNNTMLCRNGNLPASAEKEKLPMERKRTSDFPQELLDEFHLYVHGDIDRRTFLDRAGKYAVGGLTAAAIFDLLKPNYAWAEQVPKNDPRIKAEYATVS